MLISNAFTKSMTSTTEVFVTVHQPVHVIYLSTISTLCCITTLTRLSLQWNPSRLGSRWMQSSVEIALGASN